MTGIDVNDVESGKLAAKKLKDKYNANTVVITMGKLGCVFTEENGDCEHVDIPKVEKVVDTTVSICKTILSFYLKTVTCCFESGKLIVKYMFK